MNPESKKGSRPPRGLPILQCRPPSDWADPISCSSFDWKILDRGKTAIPVRKYSKLSTPGFAR
jgi:hypothetical protein